MAPRKRMMDNLVIENATIILRNFSGKEGRYNRAGDRNFGIVLTDELARQMEADGWAIKWLKPKLDIDPEATPTPWLKVKVNYPDPTRTRSRPPQVTIVTSRNKTDLDESDVKVVDWAEITNVDVEVRPYQWTMHEGTPDETSGVSAYLQSIYITIAEDKLRNKYANVPDDGQAPATGEYWDEQDTQYGRPA